MQYHFPGQLCLLLFPPTKRLKDKLLRRTQSSRKKTKYGVKSICGGVWSQVTGMQLSSLLRESREKVERFDEDEPNEDIDLE